MANSWVAPDPQAKDKVMLFMPATTGTAAVISRAHLPMPAESPLMAMVLEIDAPVQGRLPGSK